MHLFDKLRNKQRVPNEAEIHEIRERVESIRHRVGHREVGIADLFGLVGEDEGRAYRREPEPEAGPEEIARVWPHEIEDRSDARYSTGGLAELLWDKKPWPRARD